MDYDSLIKKQREVIVDAVFGALENGGVSPGEEANVDNKTGVNAASGEGPNVDSAKESNVDKEEELNASDQEGTSDERLNANERQSQRRGDRVLYASKPDIMFALDEVTPEWKRREHMQRLKGVGNAVEASDPTEKFLRGRLGSPEWKEHLALYSGYEAEALTPELVQQCCKNYKILAQKHAQGQTLNAMEQRLLNNTAKIANFELLRQKLNIDLGLVEACKAEQKGRSNFDTENMERFFFFHAEQDNWFYDSVDEDPTERTQLITTTATTEVDDRFNHVDVACAALGEATGFKPLIFGVDFTSQPDPAKMHEKMRWVHTRGRNEAEIERARRDPKIGLVGTQISPAGPPPDRSDPNFEHKMVIWNGKRHSDYNLKDRYRLGTKLPGFAALNYAWFNEVEKDSKYPKGEQPIVERFVVGASSEVLKILVSPPPNREDAQYVGKPSKYENALARFRQGQDTAESILKWCTLLECRQQAQDIATMLRRLPPSEVQRLEREAPEDFQRAKEDSARAVAYFTEAVEKAKEQTGVVEHTPSARLGQNDIFALINPEQVAYECAIRDEVFQMICRESHALYCER